MAAALNQPKGKKRITVIRNYDIAADAKSRISLRGARTKYFHVTALSNGSFVLEPRVLVAPEAISPRTLKTLKSSEDAQRCAWSRRRTCAQFTDKPLQWPPSSSVTHA